MYKSVAYKKKNWKKKGKKIGNEKINVVYVEIYSDSFSIYIILFWWVWEVMNKN